MSSADGAFIVRIPVILCAAALLALPTSRTSAPVFSAAYASAPATRAICPLPTGTSVTNNVIARIQVGPGNELSAPTEMATQSGSIWVLNHRGGSLVGINPTTNRITKRIKLPGSSRAGQFHYALAAGAGAIWLGGPWLTRVDVQRGIASTISRTSGSTAIGFGYLWLADDNHKILWRLSLQTGKVLAKFRLEKEGLQGLGNVAVGNGSLWVDDPENALILRVNPQSGKVIKQMHLGYGPGGILFNGRTMWVSDSGKAMDLTKAGCSTLYEVDANTYAIKARVPMGPFGGSVMAMAGGHLWVRTLPTLLVALNPASGQVEEALKGFPTGHYAGGILSSNGSLWVANWQDGTVWRVRL